MNLLAQKLETLDNEEIEKFKAGLILQKIITIKDAINLTANINQINVFPSIRNEHELSSYLIISGIFEFDDSVLPFIDIHKVCSKYLWDHKVAFTEIGFAEDCQTEDKKVELYDGVNLPDDYKTNMGID